ncbi:MAG TPA: DUF177 domain-containing protein [Acidobacteriota bacterium]|nr:DUF177 domain-containing protein [Acidobacteriota bacterium]
MIIDINELRERGEPLVVDANYSESELKIHSETTSLTRPAHARLRVSLAGERLRVTGHLSADLEIACSRCLKPVGMQVDKDVDLEYWPDPEVEKEGEEIALSYEELSIGFYRGELFDLSGVVSEQIVLEIPMKPVCDEACLGLCPQCGVDLNETTCDCAQDTLDPRWAALVDLKRKLK